MSNILSKQEFVNIIEKLEVISRFEEERDKLYSKFNGGYIDDPHTVLFETVIHTLNVMFSLEETNLFGSDIDYFCYDLDFGRNPNDLWIEDNEGNKFVWKDAGELYDYITNKEKENKA